MSKLMKRLTALLLLAALITLLPATAYAATSYFPKEDEVLGTSDDISGYILPDDESTSGSISGGTAGTDAVVIPDPIDGGDWKLIFSIRADRVTDLLVSYLGNKVFFRNQLSDNATYFLLKGTLMHSADDVIEGGALIKSGICYFDSDKELYIPEWYIYSRSGEKINEIVRIDEVIGSRTQRAHNTFIKNIFVIDDYESYSYGDLSLYYA